MSNIPKMKGRFQQKIGTTEDWQKAHEAGFVPLEGEIIVYQDYKDGTPVPPRYKVGNGNTLVGDLPFSAGGVLEEGLNPTSVQQDDTGSLAGVKGLYWTELTATWLVDEDRREYCFNLAQAPYSSADATIDLDTIANYFSPGDILTIHGGNKLDKALTVLEVTAADWNGNPCQLICEGHSSLLDKLQNGYKAGMDFSDNAIFCPAKPEAGVVDFGKYSFAVGHNTKALNYGATAFGRDTEAYGQYSMVVGRDTSAGYAAFADGRFAHAEGPNSVATGLRVKATAIGAHAEGGSEAGNTATVDSNWTVAMGKFSHAEGGSTKALGDFSHAEGNFTTASGTRSHAEGYNTQTGAGATGAHAEGINTKALGAYSHTEGEGTVSTRSSQHVQGRYNALDADDNSSIGAFIIGGGTDANDRKDIHIVDWSGNAWYQGDIIADNISLKGTYNSIALKGTNAEGAKGLGANSTASYGAALGWRCAVTGGHGMAFGACLTAAGGQTAFGKANAPAQKYKNASGEEKTAIFMVGNGTTDAGGNVTNPSNAFVVLGDGTGYLGDKKIQTVTPGYILTDVTSRTEDLQKGGVYLVLTRSQTSDECYDSFVLYCSGGGYFYTTTDGAVIQANQVAYNMSVQPFIFTPGENAVIEVIRIA